MTLFGKLFGQSKPSAPPEQPRPSRSVFTTDLGMQYDPAEAREIAIRRAFPVQKVSVIDPSGASIAMDSFGEIKQGFGNFTSCVPDALAIWYSTQSFIGYQLCAMFAQQWLVDKACTMPARDAVRTGYEISIPSGVEVDPDKLAALRAMDDRFKINDQMVEFVRMGNIFGIRIALFVVESSDPEYYLKPFNIDGVRKGSYKGVSQIDPYWITPQLSPNNVADPMALDFYEPMWWRVNGKLIHRSHVAIMRPNVVPDILKPSYMYGGVSVPQKIYERVYAAERTANEGPLLAMTKRLNVLHTDLAMVEANKEQVLANVQTWSQLRDNYGVKIADTGETIEQFETSLADLDAVIMQQYELVAAIANVPSTKLLGKAPNGLNATGEYDESSYHEHLESIQTHDLTPMLQRHHELCIKSEISPDEPFPTTVAWLPLDSPTAAERADINLKKAQTGEILGNLGAIDGKIERQRITLDPDSGYANVPDIDTDLEFDEGNEAGDDRVEGLDAADFEPRTGKYAGAVLITNQTYLNPAKVREKQEARDYAVQLSPEFTLDGKAYRVIIDGHHSLAAAIRDGADPTFVEGEYKGSDYRNAVTKGYAFDAYDVHQDEDAR